MGIVSRTMPPSLPAQPPSLTPACPGVPLPPLGVGGPLVRGTPSRKALATASVLAAMALISWALDIRWPTRSWPDPAPAVYELQTESGTVSFPRGQGDPRLPGVLRLLVEMPGGLIARGSGAWTDRGVYTAWHVVSGATSVTVYDAKGVAHKAWGWWRLGGQDVALVRLDAPLEGVRAYHVADGPMTRDGQADALGYWGLGADSGHVGASTGQVLLQVPAIPSAMRELGPDFYATTIPIVPGMSGGPMLSGDTIYGVVSHLVNGRTSYFARCDAVSAPPLSPVRVKPAVPIHASQSAPAPVTQDPRWGRQPVPRLAPVTPKDCKT